MGRSSGIENKGSERTGVEELADPYRWLIFSQSLRNWLMLKGGPKLDSSEGKRRSLKENCCLVPLLGLAVTIDEGLSDDGVPGSEDSGGGMQSSNRRGYPCHETMQLVGM